MPFTESKPAALLCHPASSCDAVVGVQAGAQLRPGGVLVVDYFLQGDMSRLYIPPVSDSRRADQLWKHTCFEIFVALGAMSSQAPGGYLELNFSPSTQWAAYRFAGYRAGMEPAQSVGRPQIAVEVTATSLRLVASLAIGAWAKPRKATVLHAALSAIIEEAGGGLSYWALRHPGDKPDFHHPDGFVLEIQA